MNQFSFILSRIYLIVMVLFSAGLLASCASTSTPSPCTPDEQKKLSQKTGTIKSAIDIRDIKLKNLKAQIAKNQCQGSLNSRQPQYQNCRNLIRQANQISRELNGLQNHQQVISKVLSGKSLPKGVTTKQACGDDTAKPVNRKAIPSVKRPVREKPQLQANYKPVNYGSFITFENQPKPADPVQTQNQEVPQKTHDGSSPLSSIVTFGTPTPARQPETREASVQPITPRVERPYDPNQKVRQVGQAFYHAQQEAIGRPVPGQTQHQ